MSLPPANITPHGPTNLEQSLLDIAKGLEEAGPKQLLLITDANAEIKNPPALEAALRKKNIHLHLLAIENGTALPVLRRIVRNTGGAVVKELDPQKWAQGVQQLMREASPKLLGSDPLAVHFEGELSTLPALQAMPWNRTWVKGSAAEVAGGTDGDKPVPAGARWNIGEGRVLALAFDPGPATVEKLAGVMGRPPHDPRYRVTWETAAVLRVSIDAVDGKQYLNGQSPRLELSQEADTSSAVSAHDIPQTGPGHYELKMPAPRTPTFAALRIDGHLIERIAVAGRYAPEFDAVGNDHDAMHQLALQTDGQLIHPRQIWPIDFRWPVKLMDMTSLFAGMGALLMAVGLGWWKMRA
jgi:hypothetical protein